MQEKKVPVDGQLIRQAMAATGAADARTVVEIALRELIQGPRRLDLTELAGRIEFHDDFDHKQLRELRRDAG
jgi:hypothetical protein